MLFKDATIQSLSSRSGHTGLVTTFLTSSHIPDEMEQKEIRQAEETMEQLYDAI